MRTREEQIAHLSCAIFNEKPGDIDNCISLAREYILEAERRAEQRVRAEIQHRVTSDKNKDRHEDIKEYAEGMSKEFWSICLRLHPDQDYSSLSAVSIFRCGYDLGAKEARAEIGRDSERLDWLEDIVESGFRVSPAGKGFTGASFNHGYGGIIAATLRSAIDAAREVG